MPGEVCKRNPWRSHQFQPSPISGIYSYGGRVTPRPSRSCLPIEFVPIVDPVPMRNPGIQSDPMDQGKPLVLGMSNNALRGFPNAQIQIGWAMASLPSN